jgi:hypothetical protein
VCRLGGVRARKGRGMFQVRARGGWARATRGFL